MRHRQSNLHNHLLVSHEKVFVLIKNICTVYLGVEGNPSQEFLIVPQDTDITAMVPMIEERLPYVGVSRHYDPEDKTTFYTPEEMKRREEPHTAVPYVHVSKFWDADGNPLLRRLGPKTERDEALRVYALVQGMQTYREIANVSSNMDVDVVKSIKNPVVRELTKLLCRDFCVDARFNNVWKKDTMHNITYRGAMHGSLQHPLTPTCFRRLTEWNRTGAFFQIHRNKTCPGGDMDAIVLDASSSSFMTSHIAFYTVMQTSEKGTRVVLYVVCPRVDGTPNMRVTDEAINSDTVSTFTYKALTRVRAELRRNLGDWNEIFKQAQQQLEGNKLGIP